jgi:tetratricopeptide (TPR) repeat protein
MIRSGDTVGAAKLAPQAIENAKRHGWPDKAALARQAWGAALRENGDLSEADRVLSEFPRPGKENAAVKLALGDADQALSIVDATLKRMSAMRRQLEPHSADLLVLRGRALLQLGRATEAREAFRAADEYWRGYDRDSTYAAEAQYWYGRTLVATGDVARGRPWMQQAQPRLAKSHLASHRALAASTEAPLMPAPAR